MSGERMLLGKEGGHNECPEIRRMSVGLVSGQKEPSVGTWAVEIHGHISKLVPALTAPLTWGKRLNLP